MLTEEGMLRHVSNAARLVKLSSRIRLLSVALSEHRLKTQKNYRIHQLSTEAFFAGRLESAAICQPTGSRLYEVRITSSMLPLTKYRSTVIFSFCPIRTKRPIACSSTAGFHCGSRMCTRVAAVRFKLLDLLGQTFRLKARENLTQGHQYP